MNYYVDIFSLEDPRVLVRLGPLGTEQLAIRLDIDINLNLDKLKYYTRIVEDDS